MQIKYVKVKLIKEWNGDPPGTPFTVDDGTAQEWVKMERAEIVPITKKKKT